MRTDNYSTAARTLDGGLIMSLLDIAEGAHMLFWNLREGAWRLEECGLLTVTNDNVIE